MQKEIVILGVTSFPEIRQIIEDMNDANPDLSIVPVAFLDDDAKLHNQLTYGIPVAGFLKDWQMFPNAQFVMAIGSYKTRLVRHQILERLKIPRDRFFSLIHPSAIAYAGSPFGAGNIIHPSVIFMGETKIGDFVIAMPQALVQGFSIIGKGVMLSPASCTSAYVSIGPFSHIGTGSFIAPGVKIGAGVQIIAGSYLFKDISDGIVCGGNPARSINRIAVPDFSALSNPQ